MGSIIVGEVRKAAVDRQRGRTDRTDHTDATYCMCECHQYSLFVGSPSVFLSAALLLGVSGS